MSIMLPMMFLWIIWIICRIISYTNQSKPIIFEDYYPLFPLLVLFVFIVYLSAQINRYLTTQLAQFFKINQQVFEIYSYAKDYLGKNRINSENPFLQLAIKQLRLKIKNIVIVRKIRSIFRFKKNLKNSLLFIPKKQPEIIEIETKKLLQINQTINSLMDDIKNQ